MGDGGWCQGNIILWGHKRDHVLSASIHKPVDITCTENVRLTITEEVNTDDSQVMSTIDEYNRQTDID